MLLPIEKKEKEILDAIENNDVCIITAETGAVCAITVMGPRNFGLKMRVQTLRLLLFLRISVCVDGTGVVDEITTIHIDQSKIMERA